MHSAKGGLPHCFMVLGRDRGADRVLWEDHLLGDVDEEFVARFYSSSFFFSFFGVLLQFLDFPLAFVFSLVGRRWDFGSGDRPGGTQQERSYLRMFEGFS